MSLEHLELIPAGPEHETFVFDLRNMPGVRTWMFNSRPLNWESHKKWYRGSLVSEFRQIWILLSRKRAVGQLRFDRCRDRAEVGIAMVESAQGRGLGTRFLICACYPYLTAHPDLSFIWARIKPENQRSVHAFLSAGFVFWARYDDALELRLFNGIRQDCG